MPITTLSQLAVAVRAQRLRSGLTQAQLAERAGVSRWWVSEFEAGKARAEVGLMLRVLEALGAGLEVVEAGGGDAPRPAARHHVDLDALLRDHGDV